ncbi:hypothetical protein I7I50_09274 [Histoplasma capsulatum G186AR]|uniref:Uncharacterized protein n=1 Tax=Ajellomyces capsulatus TaxID=5037 RepID=A0A8H7YV85_AJECA|nr:hypothetical protein I7I52_06795 [Histoplasma capsulatum]QSS74200.1 hypothetical protein I7I50_09274 [Histoplasma capsulatum G186AR]
MPKRMEFCSCKVIQSKPVRPRIPKCMDVTNLPDDLLFFTVLLSPSLRPYGWQCSSNQLTRHLSPSRRLLRDARVYAYAILLRQN